MWIEALVLLAGCGPPCVRFAEMTVEDPENVAGDLSEGLVAGAIADFAAWTGREGVCVPSVELHAEVSAIEKIDGQYHGPGRPIEVDWTRNRDWLYQVTQHELCHALDTEEGLSDTLGPLLPEVPRSAIYRTPEGRRREAFARACELGPRELVLRRLVEEECGVAAVSPGQAALAEQVFLGTPDHVDPDRAPLRLDWRPLTGLPEGAAPYRHAGLGEDVVVLWLRAGDGPAAWGLSRIDPATGEARGALPMPEGLGPDPGFLPTDEGLALVSAAGDRAVWWDPKRRRWTDPDLPEGVGRLAVRAEGRWVVWDEDRYAIWQGGALTPLDGELEHAAPVSLVPAPGGFVALTGSAQRRLSVGGLARYADGQWTEEPRPFSWHRGRPAVLEDGTVLLGWSVAREEGGLGGLAWVADGAWTLPEDLCEAAAWSGWGGLVQTAGGVFLVDQDAATISAVTLR
ncbi:MAG: hypothetical protein H6739_10175 [Alphaproteobacteria bacterium]|nr:hypothetical protein [Alphaproteobacteria bacterium]